MHHVCPANKLCYIPERKITLKFFKKSIYKYHNKYLYNVPGFIYLIFIPIHKIYDTATLKFPCDDF